MSSTQAIGGALRHAAMPVRPPAESAAPRDGLDFIALAHANRVDGALAPAPAPAKRVDGALAPAKRVD